jgi:hypothetical protein
VRDAGDWGKWPHGGGGVYDSRANDFEVVLDGESIRVRVYHRMAGSSPPRRDLRYEAWLTPYEIRKLREKLHAISVDWWDQKSETPDGTDRWGYKEPRSKEEAEFEFAEKVSRDGLATALAEASRPIETP